MEQMDTSEKTQGGALTCSLCNVECPSEKILEVHENGLKHQKKIKRQEIEKLWAAKDPSVYCSLCELALEPALIASHYAGLKHKAAETNSKPKRQKPVVNQTKPNQVGKNALVGTITCEFCNVSMNNVYQANDHFCSKIHMANCVKLYQEENKRKVLTEKGNFCETCKVWMVDLHTYELHLQGFKHNYKAKQGNFDPNSPFAAKSIKMKEKMQKMKEMRKLAKAAKKL